MLRWMRAKRKSKTEVVAERFTPKSELFPGPALSVVPTVEQTQGIQRVQATLGMQGYAPTVSISKNRRYCEFCAERVLPSMLHVCWGNAEHHMHTLTAQDRARIMAQLANKPRKLTKSQLKKLYAADGLGAARY